MRRLLLLTFPALLMACAGDDAGPSDPTCLDESSLARLDEHAEALRFSAAMLAGHPGPREAIGFFVFPGLEVQRAAVYAGPLVMECADALLYDEYCEEDGLCSQIECTGAGTSWEMHFRLQAPVAAEISYESATVDTAWSDGDDGITFTITSEAGDWSMTATGRMDTDSLELTEELPGLVVDATTTLTIMDDSEGNHGGSITIDGEIVAAPDADGQYVAVEACR